MLTLILKVWLVLIIVVVKSAVWVAIKGCINKNKDLKNYSFQTNAVLIKVTKA